MNITDKFASMFKKENLNFQVTNQDNWKDYTYLLDQNSYLDQYFGWTYKASITRANSISFYQPELYLVGKDGKDTEVENLPILNDLRHFNDYQTWSEARRIIQLHRDLAGIAFLHIVKSENPKYTYDFFILDPTRMKVKSNQYGLPASYIFTTTKGQDVSILNEDLIVYREPNPKNWLWGYSPLSASRFAHNTYELASKYNMNMFGNMGRPDGFLVFDGISEDERRKIEGQLKQKYTGVQNAKKLGILNKMVSFIETSKTQEELQYIEGMQMMRDEILSIFGVPKAIVGLNDSTYNNASEAQRIYQQYTVLPELFKEAEILNEQLLPKYYAGTKFNYSQYEFRFEDPVEADKEKEANYTSVLYNAGIITLNEARTMVGETEIDSGSTFKTIQNQVVMPIEKPESVKPEAEYNEEEKAIKEVKKSIDELNTRFDEQVVDNFEELNREGLKKFFDINFDKNNKKFIASIQSFFEEQSKRVTGSISTKKKNKKSTYGIEMDLEKETKIAVQTFIKDLYNIALDSNYIANKLTNNDQMLTDKTLLWIKDKTQYFAKEMNQTSIDKLNQMLIDAEMNDWTLEQLKSSIKDLFDKWSYGDKEITVSRAELIASTEQQAVANKTAIDNYSLNEYVIGLEWLAVGDNKTRHTHIDVDGQIVARKTSGDFEKFIVGGKAMYGAGDPAGGPAEICNCRCRTLPVISE